MYNVGDEHTGHHHGMAKKSLRTAFFLSFVILIVGVVGGIFANSLALLSDAAHTVTDLFALGLAWFAAVQVERPSNERKTFGYHRVGILAALINALSLMLIAIVITWEAVQRFQHPEPVQPVIMFVSATIGILINLVIAFGLQKETHNLNVRAALLHVIGDVGASVAVIIAGGVMLLTGWVLVDPLLSVGIAVLIAFGAWRILRETTNILLEAAPKNISMSCLIRDMKAVPGVRDVHDLHVWSIASGMSALSCHVRIDNLPSGASTSILRSLTTVLREKHHIDHTTIQFECDTHEDSCCQEKNLYCRIEAHRDQTPDHVHRTQALSG
jgi:cobalt-zinc-cadmium efflux system protein